MAEAVEHQDQHAFRAEDLLEERRVADQRLVVRATHRFPALGRLAGAGIAFHLQIKYT
jgi:hypothetical protein